MSLNSHLFGTPCILTYIYISICVIYKIVQSNKNTKSVKLKENFSGTLRQFTIWFPGFILNEFLPFSPRSALPSTHRNFNIYFFSSSIYNVSFWMRENGSIDITIYNLMHSLMQKLSSILPITSFKLKLETLFYIPRATQKKV